MDFYTKDAITNYIFHTNIFSWREKALLIFFYLFSESYDMNVANLSFYSRDDKRTILKSLHYIAENPIHLESELDEWLPILNEITLDFDIYQQYEEIIFDKRLSWRSKGIIMYIVYFQKVDMHHAPEQLDTLYIPFYYQNGIKDTSRHIKNAFDELVACGYLTKTH